jgi:hypothetical protein
MKNKLMIVIFLSAACIILSNDARATTPMISPIANQYIPMNSSTPVLSFTVSDNETAPGDLVVTYRSLNPGLVPATDSNITLGGSGASRTVQVAPLRGKWGVTTIVIIVTDGDGDQTGEPFDVEVQRPPE